MSCAQLVIVVMIVLCRLASSADATAATWTTNGPTFKALKAVAISPQDTNVVYAGAFGWGVFKSTDGGATWASQRAGLTNAYVRSLLVTSNAVVYCGTNDGIFKTSDGGATWALSVATPFSVRGLAVDPSTGAVYAATYGAGLYKTVTQGTSWVQIVVTDPIPGMSLAHLRCVAVYGNDSLYVGGSIGDVATGGALFKTGNGGGSWTQVQQGIGIRSSVHSIAVSPTNPNTSLVIGTAAKGVYKSTNGGTNWTEINGATTANPIPDEKVNAVGFSVLNRYAGTDSLGGLYSRALGDTSFGWTAGTGLPGTSAVVSAMAVNTLQPNSMFLATEGRGAYRSTNAGVAWAARNTGMLGTAPRVIRRNGDGKIFAGTEFGDGLWVSTDQGGTWSAQAIGTSNAITAIGITSTSSTLYAGAYGTGVLKSTNTGATWTVTDSTVLNHFVRALCVHPSNPATVYAGTGNGVYLTTDAGASWAPRNNGIPPSTSIRSMAIDPVAPSTLYAGTDSLFLYKTTDGGGTWSHVTSANGFLPQDIFIRTITIDYADHAIVYAGSDSGRVYKSTNAGAGWTLLSRLPVTHSVRGILIHPNDHKIFFCATFGDGIFVSADSGAHWAPMNDGLADAEFYSLESDQGSPLTLYAGSGMHGVYKTSYVFVNHAPVLAPIGSQNVIAGDALSFVVNATDPDATMPALTASGLPSGASFVDSANGRGRLAWTPTLGQVGSYLITFVASDGAASDTERVTITVLAPGSSTIVSLAVEAGWSIVSVPVIPSDPRKSVLFSTAVSSAFAYTGSYAVRETLTNGPGYWLKYASPQALTLGGGSLDQETLAVRSGWNIIGSLSVAVPVGGLTAVPPLVVTSSVYGFSFSTGYAAADSVRPGFGYWVKVSQDGQLVLSSLPSASPSVIARAGFSDGRAPVDRVTFLDAFGNARTLLLGNGAGEELPPPPPAGVFDARFTGGDPGARTYALTSAGSAVTVDWEIRTAGRTYELSLGSTRLLLAGSGSTMVRGLARRPSGSIVAREGAAGAAGMPGAPRLVQNYPNPLNPSTTVRFELPAAAHVTLRVFDVLGREVALLENGIVPAGTHERTWDASPFGSGVYYLRFDAVEDGRPGAAVHDVRSMYLVK